MKNSRTLIALILAFVLHSQISPNIAFARPSGGGDSAKFDTGQFALSIGIGLASSYIGYVGSEAINAGAHDVSVWSGGTATAANGGATYGGASGAISSYGNVGSWAANYNSMAALNQVGSGISSYGSQQGWDSSKTVLVSSVAQGAVGGFLSPSTTLGLSSTVPNYTFSNQLKAVTVGVVSGTTEGLILAANVDSGGRINPWVGAAAGLTGSFVGGVASASIAPVVPSKSKAGSYYKANTFSSQALTHGAVKTFSAIPSSAISMGVSTLIKDKDMDQQDALMVRQAFSGVYPILGAYYKNKFRDPVLESETLGLGHYTEHNGLEGTPFQQRGKDVD